MTTEKRRRGAPYVRMAADDPRLAAPDFPHGEPRGASRGCPCDPCRIAKNKDLRDRRARKREENPQPAHRVPAAPARIHLFGLLGPDVSLSAVARAAGLPVVTVINLNDESFEKCSLATSEAIRATTAEAVRKCSYAPERVAPRLRTLLEFEDCTPMAIAAAAGLNVATIRRILDGDREVLRVATVRALRGLTPYIVRRNAASVSPRRAATRLRALQANGWSLRALGQRLGYAHGLTMHQFTGKLILQDLDRRVEALYLELENRPGGNSRSAEAAARLGYYPPIYYDDDMNLVKAWIPPKYNKLATSTQERARNRLRVMGLTLRNHSAPEIENLVKVESKTVERARKMVGLHLARNPAEVLVADAPYIQPGQEELIEIIAKHTAGIALLEPVDAIDDPDIDYAARWKSLVAAAEQHKARAAYVALWEKLLAAAEIEQPVPVAA